MGRIQRLVGATSVICLSFLISAIDARGQDIDLMLTKYIDTLNANMPPNLDPEALSLQLSETAVQRQPFDEPSQGARIGRDAAREFYGRFDEIFTEWTHVEEFRMTEGNQAIWEGIAQGTHKETGKPLRLPIVFFLTFDKDGLVTESRTYVDVHLIAQQLEAPEDSN